MTLIELNKVAKEGDRGTLPDYARRITFPIRDKLDSPRWDDGTRMAFETVLRNDWQLIPKAKEFWVNVYERENLYVRSVQLPAKVPNIPPDDYRGTIKITYDGKLKVEVVE